VQKLKERGQAHKYIQSAWRHDTVECTLGAPLHRKDCTCATSMIPLEGLGLFEKPGLEQQIPSNDRHTAVVAPRWGLCGVYGTRVSRSRIPSQTRGSIGSEQAKERKV